MLFVSLQHGQRELVGVQLKFEVLELALQLKNLDVGCIQLLEGEGILIVGPRNAEGHKHTYTYIRN